MTVINKFLSFYPFYPLSYLIVTSLNQFASSMFLTILCADRYIAVCHAIVAPKFRTPFISKFVCVTAWALVAVLITPIFLFANTDELRGRTTCNLFWPPQFEQLFTISTFLVTFAIPLVLFVVFYTLVLLKLNDN